MSHDQLFQIANTMVLPGWALYIFAPRWKWTPRLVLGIIVTLLSVLYVWLVGQTLAPSDLSAFSTLEGLSTLFTSKGAILTGWVHYLAFDLMVGWYILTNAREHGIHHGWVVPCLLFTFMLGPSGLLIYFLIRMVKMQEHFGVI